MVYSFSFLPGRTTHPYRVPTTSYPLVSLFRVCMYVCMYACMYAWMHVYPFLIHFFSFSFVHAYLHLHLLSLCLSSFPFTSHLHLYTSLHSTSLPFTSPFTFTNIPKFTYTNPF